MNRRTFLAGATAAATGALTSLTWAAGSQRKKIAFLGTEVRLHSHAQHFLDRLTMGYGWRGGWQRPRIDVASVFIDQFPDGDLARQRAKRHNLKLFPTIAEALTLGGNQLAVDGVVIIGEHGNYPKNEKGQTLYPRYEWFKEVVKVFEASGRAVPVFNDNPKSPVLQLEPQPSAAGTGKDADNRVRASLGHVERTQRFPAHRRLHARHRPRRPRGHAGRD